MMTHAAEKKVNGTATGFSQPEKLVYSPKTLEAGAKGMPWTDWDTGSPIKNMTKVMRTIDARQSRQHEVFSLVGWMRMEQYCLDVPETM